MRLWQNGEKVKRINVDYKEGYPWPGQTIFNFSQLNAITPAGPPLHIPVAFSRASFVGKVVSFRFRG